MLLGFERRFAPFVEEGSKTHTIRAIRKNPPRVGETCHCYVDPRQKTMRLLGRWPCVKIEVISVWHPSEREQLSHAVIDDVFLAGVQVGIDGALLDLGECNALAWRDGFRSYGRDHAFAEMMEFWRGRLPFTGTIIHWQYTAAAKRRRTATV